jgi:hypothetical protein
MPDWQEKNLTQRRKGNIKYQMGLVFEIWHLSLWLCVEKKQDSQSSTYY